MLTLLDLCSRTISYAKQEHSVFWMHNSDKYNSPRMEYISENDHRKEAFEVNELISAPRDDA